MTMARLLIAGAILVCASIAAAWFLSNFERRTQTEPTGFRGKARHDQWLAARRLLQRMGAQTGELNALAELDNLPEGAALVLPKGRQGLGAQARRSALGWVKNGGRLIVEAEPAYQPYPLLDAFGVRRKVVGSAARDRGRTDDDDTLVHIALPPGLVPVEVLMDGTLDLQAKSARARFGTPPVTAAVLLQYGEGEVLALNRFAALSNHSIGLHDHAEFLWRIVQVDGAPPLVIFFSDAKKLSLFDWLLAQAWPAIAGGASLLLLWLWGAIPRMCPVAPDPLRERRRLLDHLRASGRFLWTRGGAQRLADAAREACLRRIAQVHPELLAAPDAEREARLAELAGLDAAQARALFSQQPSTRMTDFLRTISLYQTVHETIALKRGISKIPKERA